MVIVISLGYFDAHSYRRTSVFTEEETETERKREREGERERECVCGVEYGGYM